MYPEARSKESIQVFVIRSKQMVKLGKIYNCKMTNSEVESI